VVSNTVHLYPNPCKTHFTISMSEYLRCEIFNVLGIKVLSSFDTHVDLSGLLTGNYIIVIYNLDNKPIKHQKLIKF
jgi:hypothetical protein